MHQKSMERHSGSVQNSSEKRPWQRGRTETNFFIEFGTLSMHLYRGSVRKMRQEKEVQQREASHWRASDFVKKLTSFIIFQGFNIVPVREGNGKNESDNETKTALRSPIPAPSILD